MSDLGFLPAVRRLLRPHARDGAASAVLRDARRRVDRSCGSYLHDPVTHSVDRASEPVPDMTHHVFTVRTPTTGPRSSSELAAWPRPDHVVHPHQARRPAPRQAAHAGGHPRRRAARQPQPERPRPQPRRPSRRQAPVLVATDIAARGIHVDDVALVVHVDPPTEHKAYLHRSGRTARAGAGDVVTLAAPDQRDDVAKMTRKAGIRPRNAEVGPGARTITELVGEAAPRVRAEDRPAAPETRSQSRPESRPGAGAGSDSGRPRRRGGRGGRGWWRRRWWRRPQRWWWPAGVPRRAGRAGWGGQPPPSIPLRHPSGAGVESGAPASTLRRGHAPRRRTDDPAGARSHLLGRRGRAAARPAAGRTS